MVVFCTCLTVGHETRFISARTSCKNCARRPAGLSAAAQPALAARCLAFRSFTKARGAWRDESVHLDYLFQP